MKSLKITIVAAAFLIMGFNSAKAQAFESGKSFIHVGYGYSVFNPSSLVADSVQGVNSSNLGPINLMYEYAVGDKFGIGVDVGYSVGKLDYADSYYSYSDSLFVEGTSRYEKTKLTVNLRGNVHFGNNDKFDPYLGFGIGYRMVNREWDYANPDFVSDEFEALIPVSLMLRFGTRFMFTDNIGAFVEGGIGHGVFQGGIVAKL